MITYRPSSSAERQREFLQRNPGYYRRYSARRRAQAQRAREQLIAIYAAAQAAEAAKANGEPTAAPAAAGFGVQLELPWPVATGDTAIAA